MRRWADSRNMCFFGLHSIYHLIVRATGLDKEGQGNLLVYSSILDLECSVHSNKHYVWSANRM